jgi:hypothetical protein
MRLGTHHNGLRPCPRPNLMCRRSLSRWRQPAADLRRVPPPSRDPPTVLDPIRLNDDGSLVKLASVNAYVAAARDVPTGIGGYSTRPELRIDCDHAALSA